MNIIKKIIKALPHGAVAMALAIAMLAPLASCGDDEESYSDQLRDERYAVNAYLANHTVENEIPADSVLKTGTDAPFYKIEPDGNVYLQVINAGDRSNKIKRSETVYFRYARYDIKLWHEQGVWTVASGNEDDMLPLSSTYFKYLDFTLPQSTTWGYGLQMPLAYVGFGAEVNIIIKSQYGPSSELANVIPYLFHVRYYPSRI